MMAQLRGEQKNNVGRNNIVSPDPTSTLTTRKRHLSQCLLTVFCNKKMYLWTCGGAGGGLDSRCESSWDWQRVQIARCDVGSAKLGLSMWKQDVLSFNHLSPQRELSSLYWIVSRFPVLHRSANTYQQWRHRKHKRPSFRSYLWLWWRLLYSAKTSTVWWRYNAVTNIHKRHPIVRPLARSMGCLLWIQHLVYILPQLLQLLM